MILEDLRHLTWAGRATAAWYWFRRIVVDPAPSRDRCVMGSPVGEHVRCPRRSVGGSIWCSRHHPAKESKP